VYRIIISEPINPKTTVCKVVIVYPENRIEINTAILDNSENKELLIETGLVPHEISYLYSLVTINRVTNARRSEKRIEITKETLTKLSLKSDVARIFYDSHLCDDIIECKCIIRNISYSGIKVILIEPPTDADRINISLHFLNPDEGVIIQCDLLRIEQEQSYTAAVFRIQENTSLIYRLNIFFNGN
jgi:hypothetical protein